MPRFSRRLLACLGALAGCAGGALGLQPERPPARVVDLQAGPGEERELAGGESHVYRFRLATGQFVRLTVDQRGIDVVVRLLDPGGREISTVDGAPGERGQEEAELVAEKPGLYGMEVHPFKSGAKRGRYLARLAVKRHARPADRADAAAERAFWAAKALAGPAPRQAAARYRQAERFWRSLRNRPRQAEACFQLGRLAMADERWDQALFWYRRALPLARASHLDRREALIENELGRSHEGLEDLAAASAAYQRALELWSRQNDPDRAAIAATNRGKVLLQRGEILTALAVFEQALQLCPQGHDATRATILTGLGSGYAAAGDFDRANEAFDRSLALLRQPQEGQQRADALTEKANAAVEADAPERALPLFLEALQQRPAADLHGRAVDLNGIGLVDYQLRRFQEALPAYRSALGLFTRKHDRRAQGTALINIAWVQSALGQQLPALGTYRQALALARRSEHRAAEAAALYGMAVAERRRGAPIAARDRAEAALKIVESLRSEAAHRDLKAAYLATKQGFYEFLIDLLMEEHRRQPLAGFEARALEVSERARARSLLDSVAGSRAGSALGPAPGAPGPRPLSLREIQALLDDRTLLLEYQLGEPRSFLWLVGPTSLVSFELPGRAKIESLARQVHGLFQQSGRRRTDGQAAQQSELALGRLLLGQVAGRLGEKRLLIAAHDALQLVPFAALPDVTTGAEIGGGEEPAPLVLRHEVVEIASLSVLAILRGRRLGRPSSPGLLALFGDPVTDLADPRLRGLPGVGAVRQLSPLGDFPPSPHASEEAAAILGLARGGEVLQALGFAATRERALGGDLRRFRILHFAAHGILDATHPDLSALVLSRFDSLGRPRDGSLRAKDLYALDVPADLVVLSACQTALGREVHGEGLVGLPQGFLSAGAARVLVSLWNVRDSSTAELMKRFYSGLLARHLSPAAALREAQVALWRDPRWHAPYHWAGFVLQGEPR